MMSQNPVSGYARLDGGIAGHLYSTYFLSSDAANTVSLGKPRAKYGD